MKKSMTLFVALACGLSFGTAHALQLNTAVGITTAEADCPILNEAVKPALSKNVTLHYSCNADQNLVKVASCHQFGSRKIETVACAVTGETEGVTQYNDASCDGTPSQTFQTGNFGKAFTGASSGGSVAATALTAACDDTGSSLTGFVD